MSEDRGQINERERRNERPVRSFEDLEAFRRAYAISLEVHRHSLGWSALEQRALAEQLRRSSKAICANIAEGWGRQHGSAVEFKRYLVMAIGSVEETRLWLRYGRDLGHLGAAQQQRWHEEYGAIARMLQGLRKAWR